MSDSDPNFPPGASTDVVARLMADHISKAHGVTMVVENRPGASGMIGTEFVSRATPDGNTLLMTANTYLIDAQIRKASYHPVTAFDPMCLLVESPAVFSTFWRRATHDQPNARKQIAADSVDAVERGHDISCTVDQGHCSGARYERATKHRSRHRAF